MAKLNTYVHVRDEAGENHVFGPDDTVPGWARQAITNPNVWEGADESSETSSDEPPRSGKGSGVEAWLAYAESKGIDMPEDASRDDVIAAVDAAKE